MLAFLPGSNNSGCACSTALLFGDNVSPAVAPFRYGGLHGCSGSRTDRTSEGCSGSGGSRETAPPVGRDVGSNGRGGTGGDVRLTAFAGFSNPGSEGSSSGAPETSASSDCATSASDGLAEVPRSLGCRWPASPSAARLDRRRKPLQQRAEMTCRPPWPVRRAWPARRKQARFSSAGHAAEAANPGENTPALWNEGFNQPRPTCSVRCVTNTRKRKAAVRGVRCCTAGKKPVESTMAERPLCFFFVAVFFVFFLLAPTEQDWPGLVSNCLLKYCNDKYKSKQKNWLQSTL